MFALHYPGIKKVEHEYFHAVNMAEGKTLQAYLERAYQLGKEFANKKVEVSTPSFKNTMAATV